MGAFVYLYSVLRTIAALCPAPKPSNASALQDYPVISILLPVYNEAHMLKTLTSHILCTKYPAERLDIVIVCEPDDTETVTAARCLDSDDIAVFVTDGSGPRTKPNALNQALPICRGEIITVYDAEDRPDPAQLHAAAAALFNDQSLAVVQAPLIYYNSNQNWLTRQFTLEYAALFFVWLPFLSRLGLPFPLGGTSNHIRRSALEAVGGWDAYNVTEDADLSFRLAAFGWKLGYITPPTHEEAVSSWPQWTAQRNRWMKGYAQTWVTHGRHPLTPGRRQGFVRFFTLQLTVAVTLMTGLLHVPGLLFLIVGAALTQSAPPLILGVTGYCYAAGIFIGIIGAIRAKQPKLMLSAITMPFYWLALFVPTLQALWDLKYRPFHWNKTTHGANDAAISNLGHPSAAND